MNVDKVFDRKREIISMPVDKSYKSKNPLVRWYFTSIHRISVELAGLKGNEAILDFGCGSKELSKRLQNYKVYNYDINPDLTEVKDYKKLKPDVIFAISAFTSFLTSSRSNFFASSRETDEICSSCLRYLVRTSSISVVFANALLLSVIKS